LLAGWGHKGLFFFFWFLNLNCFHDFELDLISKL
jgi:hypothetical protein